MLSALRITTAVAALLAVGAPAAGAAVGTADVQPHLQRLAEIADANGGNRAAGTPGEAATVEYAASELAAAGWTVRRQPVPIRFWQERSAPQLGSLVAGRDFVTLIHSPSADVTAPVARIGRTGCRRRDFPRSARRALVVTADRGPQCEFRRAAANAKRAGAVGLVIPVPRVSRSPVQYTLISPGARVPVVAVSRSIAKRLRGPIRLRVDAFGDRRNATNVIADLPGRSSRVLVLGGHHDSVRRGPGINDNGSGVAGLLALARTFGAATDRKQTLRIGLWGVEEDGLIGSARYVRSLSRTARRRISAYLNVDMIGSPNPVVKVYASTKRIRRALKRDLPRAGRESVDVPTDSLPFLDAGVPVGGIYTGSDERGPGGKPRDPCYHLACDTIDNVDPALTARMASALETAVRALS